MAAALLSAAGAARNVPMNVSSAGFLFEGHPASDAATKVMRERDLDLSAHRSRVLNVELVGNADLVLTMERRHARDLLLQHGADQKNVHTLKGFASSVTALVASGDAEVDDLRVIVGAVNEQRDDRALLGDGRPDEVADPHGRSLRIHRRTADEIAAAVDAIVAALAHVRSRGQ